MMFLPTDPILWDVAVEAVRLAVTELDIEHRPSWVSDEAKAAGSRPVGCVMCWPGDGHWPCTSRQIADDLRRAFPTIDDRGDP